VPEYLAPGVYVEETSFRSKSIEGVSTSTTAFVGPTRRGPTGVVPELLTSFGDFERIYGGLDNIDGHPNYMAHAVRAYFENGGSRLYVSRVFTTGADNGRATSGNLVDGGAQARFVARFPGVGGNGQITVQQVDTPVTLALMNSAPPGSVLRVIDTPDRSAQILGGTPPFSVPDGSQLFLTVNGVEKSITFRGGASGNVQDITKVTIDDVNRLLQAANTGVQASASTGGTPGHLLLATSSAGAAATLTVRSGPPGGVPAGGQAPTSAHTALGLTADTQATGADAVPHFYMKQQGAAGSPGSWHDPGNAALDTSHLSPAQAPGSGASLLTMTVLAVDADGNQLTYDGLGFDASHPRYIGNVLTASPTRQVDALESMYAINLTGTTALALRQGLFPTPAPRIVPMANGNNGVGPSVGDYEAAIELLEKLEDVAIVAAPGHSIYPDDIYLGIQQALIAHAEKRRSYRIAVLDTPPDTELGAARTIRSRIDSSYAALYYPWVTIANPVARPNDASVPQEINLPPSGFVCGIYARTDIQRGVFKAPANEVVTGAIRLEQNINFAQQEVLNPIGVNCLRFFPNRGYRVWGARTVSSDPEWKYVNVRRYFNYLEHSIDNGTQWAVFEPNGERLWADVRDTIASFLYNEWVSGALLGTAATDAFFVRCDRSTMTQNDLDNGRLVCLVGVAVLYPAEFVIFRIGQKTVDAQS